MTALRPSVVVRAAAAVGLATLGLWPSSATADQDASGDPSSGTESVEVGNAAEAWYAAPATAPGETPVPVETDPCDLPLGCLPTTPPVPVPVPDAPGPGELVYPPGTLQVETTAGVATALSYVVPDLSRVPADATLTGGVLELPLNRGETSGSVAPETAKLMACLTTEKVTDKVAGGVSGAPAYDCDAAKAPLKPVTKPADDGGEPTLTGFTVDLGPFLEAWTSGADANGVALLPAAGVGPNAAWHVTLNGDSVEKGRLAGSVIEFVPAPEDPTVDPTPVPTPDVPTVPGGGGGTGTIPPPPPPDNGDPVAAPPAPDAPVAAPVDELAPAPVSLLTSPWYSYRGVVFLPLAFLVALSLTGRSLTRPLAVVARAGRGRLAALSRINQSRG